MGVEELFLLGGWRTSIFGVSESFQTALSCSKLRDLILSTGDAELVEQTHNDRIWGDGGDGSGENRLGKLLMELRQQLREAGDGVPPPPVLPLPPGFDEENQPLKRSKSQYAGDDEGEGRKRSDDGEDATPAAPPAAAAADSGSKLNIRTGDLLQATEQYIAHQCNCVSRGARGLAKTLFAKYPHANVYQSRKSPSQPGTILVHGPPGRLVLLKRKWKDRNES